MKPDGGDEIAPSRRVLDGDPQLRWSEEERQAIVAAEEADPDLEIHSIDSRLFVSWVGEWWRQASGSSSVTGFVGEHDDVRSLNLNSGEWVAAEEKWHTDS